MDSDTLKSLEWIVRPSAATAVVRVVPLIQFEIPPSPGSAPPIVPVKLVAPPTVADKKPPVMPSANTRDYRSDREYRNLNPGVGVNQGK